MSAPQPKRHHYDAEVEYELARWPGVSWRRECGTKHPRIVLTFNGVSRWVGYAGSPSDSARGAVKHIADLRAALKRLGAVREAERKATSPKRRRNRTEPKVPLPVVEVKPVSDPLAGLVAFRRKLVDQAPFVLPITVTTKQRGWWFQ